jgi:lactobin A/cerein 7B family class IIb bacteriocin
MERADKLSEILTADPERAKTLFSLEPAEALSQINALGNDFTLDEINEYGQAVRKAAAQGELDDSELDNVAGGVIPVVAGMAISAGVSFAVSKRW